MLSLINLFGLFGQFCLKVLVKYSHTLISFYISNNRYKKFRQFYLLIYV